MFTQLHPDNSACFSLFLHNICVHAEIDKTEKKAAGDMSTIFPA